MAADKKYIRKVFGIKYGLSVNNMIKPKEKYTIQAKIVFHSKARHKT